jgi:hypothetical protein
MFVSDGIGWAPQVGGTPQTCAAGGVIGAQVSGVPATCGTRDRDFSRSCT